MNILCTMPGRHGDILWALPTIRAISQTYKQGVDLCVSAKYGKNPSFLKLIKSQPYIRYCWADPEWAILETAPITPRTPPKEMKVRNLNSCGSLYEEDQNYDLVIHLGYMEWPTFQLPRYIYMLVNEELIGTGHLPLDPLDLETPWIRPFWHPANPQPHVAVGWSDEWVELKMGVLLQSVARLEKHRVYFGMAIPSWSRQREWIEVLPMANFSYHVSDSWVLAAQLISEAHVFLGCLSAQWVLANGVGIPTVIMEPAPQRHHPIFYLEHHRNHIVRGADQGATFDARAVVELLYQVLEEEVARAKGRG